MSTVISCSEQKNIDWRELYISQEKSKITTIEKMFWYGSSGYSLSSTDTTFESFDEKGRKLGINNRHFYKYDSTGKLIAEEYCIRTCEHPVKEVYYYDSLNRLIKTTIVHYKGKEWVTAKYFYNEKNLLSKKITGNDSLPTTVTYTYDNLSRMSQRTWHEFNSNVNEWLTYIDSMFYDRNNQIVLNKRHETGKNLLMLTKYFYKDTLLITLIDTTIPSIAGHLPTATQDAVYFPDYSRKEFKYNSANKIIEKIVTQPDFKTPAWKVIYEYK